jgi:hypothetical protein
VRVALVRILRWMDVWSEPAPVREYPLAREYRRVLIAASCVELLPEDLLDRLRGRKAQAVPAPGVAAAAVPAPGLDAFAGALAAARGRRHARQRADALVAVVAGLAGAGHRIAADVAAEAYAAAVTIRDVTDRVRAVGSVVPYLPDHLLPDVLGRARRVISPYQRIPLLLALGARMDGAVAEAWGGPAARRGPTPRSGSGWVPSSLRT